MASRNVMIFGKVGAGKATVANAMFNVTPDNGFIIAKSMNSTLREATVKSKRIVASKYRGTVTLFDTIGNLETGQSQFLKQRLKQCVNEHEKDTVILILFVVRRDMFSVRDKAAFDEVIAVLETIPHASEMTAVVITCCDGKGETARRRIKQELETNTDMARLVTFAKKGVFLAGLPNPLEASEEITAKMRASIERDKEKMQDLLQICSTDSSVVCSANSSRVFEGSKARSSISSWLKVLLSCCLFCCCGYCILAVAYYIFHYCFGTDIVTEQNETNTTGYEEN